MNRATRDQRKPDRPQDIAIVGAGFTGSLLALHLLQRSQPGDRIYLIERNAQFGRGLAYSTGNPNHLLNVRAGNMSAYPDQADHFVQWLRRLPKATQALLNEYPTVTTFVPRGLYGSYIQQQLGEEIWRRGHGANLYLVTDEVVRVHREPKGAGRTKPLSIELGVGRRLPVDRCVLATGNLLPSKNKGAIVGNPWDEKALTNLDEKSDVVVLGTGLTMVDTVISLLDRGHKGRIVAVSRRGLLPRLHLSAGVDDLPRPWQFDTPPAGRNVLQLLRHVRAAAREAAAQGQDWRVVVDGLRSHTQRLWQEMPAGERARFLRHLRPWWDVHRHRSATRVMARILEAIQKRQLMIVAGRIDSMAPGGDHVSVVVRPRGKDGRLTLNAQRVLVCTALTPDLSKLELPLLRDLIAGGAARADALGLGLDVAPTGALIDADGKPAKDLFAVGPITRGTFWEITAVPDIRVACETLAEHLLPAGRIVAEPRRAARA
ncbi:MAG TPA: FAD-dependent oxidoreductase [Dongiaceae bacterium]|nr:FAD-dependent oxidoreductase [Dongiaceae bacterium]